MTFDGIDIKHMDDTQLKALAAELRAQIIAACGKNGGHLASNLGAVELTVALHAALDMQRDSLVFDVGHQCYAHKLLTGRSLDHLRRQGGVSGFPNIDEGDSFGTGHAGTAISAALGIARARRLLGQGGASVAVVGDGALGNGQCYEAMSDAGSDQTPMLVIINDNKMSIAGSVGGMARHLGRLTRNRRYLRFKNWLKKTLKKLHCERLYRFGFNFKRAVKQFMLDSGLFESLGFAYVGPIDGHDIEDLIYSIRFCIELQRPVTLHVITRKGSGLEEAEGHPSQYHNVRPSGEHAESGHLACSAAIGEKLCAMAESDERVCAITAAMPDNTGLGRFAGRFPKRFFDTGITEAHALTLACGLAKGGARPFVAIYSTFLQRSYDQLLHDMALQRLPVTVLADKACLSGGDGATHNGVYDISFARPIPGVTILSPRDISQLDAMLDYAAALNAPCIIRYPRSLQRQINAVSAAPLPAWEVVHEGTDAVVLAVGEMVETALIAAQRLKARGVGLRVLDARCIKPLDAVALGSCRALPVLTVEEGALAGGFGSAVLEAGIHAERMGVPDEFIRHGSHCWQAKQCGLTPEDIENKVLNMLGRA